jgi:hypothetical protein
MTKVVNSSLFGPTNLNMKCLFNSVVGIGTRYWARRSGNRIPVGGEIFHTRLERFWHPRSLLYNGHLVFAGCRAARVYRYVH